MPKDPYMRDPNIRKAASLQLLAWPALGAALGAAASGWFDAPKAPMIIGGVVIGYVIATLILRVYGGRATR